MALRRLGRPVPRLIGVEAEPHRSSWMKEHFVNNGLDPATHRQVHAAMAPRDGSVWIRADPHPEASYGLAVNDAGEGVRVPAVSLATLLSEEPCVDLLHIDLQGTEGDVLEAGEATLRKKSAGSSSPRIRDGCIGGCNGSCAGSVGGCVSISASALGRRRSSGRSVSWTA